MTITSGPDTLRWRVQLNAAAETVYDLLSTDSGRMRFWVESSRRNGDVVVLSFPDGTTSDLRILSEQPPRLLAVSYFNVRTQFLLEPDSPGSTMLEVSAFEVPAAELADVAAGWVSVLLNLKATVNFGVDLRNHNPARNWAGGFVDN